MELNFNCLVKSSILLGSVVHCKTKHDAMIILYQLFVSRYRILFFYLSFSFLYGLRKIEFHKAVSDVSLDVSIRAAVIIIPWTNTISRLHNDLFINKNWQHREAILLPLTCSPITRVHQNDIQVTTSNLLLTNKTNQLNLDKQILFRRRKYHRGDTHIRKKYKGKRRTKDLDEVQCF